MRFVSVIFPTNASAKIIVFFHYAEKNP